MIYEIRDYHYRPDIFDEYKAWAEEAVPVLKSLMDVVGFWIDTGEAPRERAMIVAPPLAIPTSYADAHAASLPRCTASR